MALSSAIVWEVRTTGSDTNGGGFKAGASGTDWSQQAAAQYSVTDGVTAGTTTITSASANFGTDVVGNLIYVSGGSGSVTADWYEIVSRTNSSTIVVDRATGLTAGTGVTLKIGGAMLSLSIVLAKAVAGQTAYVKNGTYTISSNTSGIANGALGGAVYVLVVGYSSTRSFGNTGDTPPVFQTSGASITASRGTGGLFVNCTFDGNNQTSARFSDAAGSFVGCLVKNYTTGSTGGGTAFGCEFVTNTASVWGGHAHFCLAHGNTATPFSSGTQVVLTHCLSYGNTGASTDGVLIQSGLSQLVNCTAANNGRDGFRASAASGNHAINCHSEGNGGFGFNWTTANGTLIRCSTYNNTSGPTNGTGTLSNGYAQTLTASALTNLAGGDLSPNNIAGAGASLRAAAYSVYQAAFLGGLTTGYLDVGAVQHGDPLVLREAAALSGGLV